MLKNLVRKTIEEVGRKKRKQPRRGIKVGKVLESLFMVDSNLNSWQIGELLKRVYE